MKIGHNSIGYLLLILWLVFTGSAMAATYVINPDGTGDYASIFLGITAAVDGDTIALTDGTFTGRGNYNLNFSGKAIVVCSQSGNAEDCIIDIAGEHNNNTAERGFIFNSGEGSSSILRDLTIINGDADAPCPECEGGAVFIDESSPTVINIIAKNNFALNGAGIMCSGECSPIIKNCKFINNEATDGGGLMCMGGTTPTITGCLFSGNVTTLRGGGVSMQEDCLATLENCTISNNSSTNGAGIAAWESNYIINNTIISFNDGDSTVFVYGESAEVTITYLDIYGNTGGDWLYPIDDQYGVNGNISEDPLYADTANGDFQLTGNSPCVDSGDPESSLDPDNTIADMGAYYYHHSVGIIEPTSPLPGVTCLKGNYPNPFNPTTTIGFNLGERTHVNLDIYNIMGRKVASLVNEVRDAGSYQITWYASEVATGTYFCKLSTDSQVSTTKMVLVK